jgi:hypothetical protein
MSERFPVDVAALQRARVDVVEHADLEGVSTGLRAVWGSGVGVWCVDGRVIERRKEGRKGVDGEGDGHGMVWAKIRW